MISITPTKFDFRKNLHSFAEFLFSLFASYSFQWTGLPNPLLRRFTSFWLCFANEVITIINNFLSLIVKIKY